MIMHCVALSETPEPLCSAPYALHYQFREDGSLAEIGQLAVGDRVKSCRETGETLKVLAAWDEDDDE